MADKLYVLLSRGRSRRRTGYFARGSSFALIRAIAMSALVLQFHAVAFGDPFAFSLDNRPRAPIGADITAPGFGNGAEDPFGILVAPIRVGPSPSLNTFSGPPLNRPLSDADILVPGVIAPQVNTQRPLQTNYIDAISSNRASNHMRRLRLLFSVDRASTGLPGSAVENQFLLNQHPGDIFISDRRFDAPGQFVGLTPNAGYVGTLSSANTGNSNLLLVNQSALTLRAGSGPGVFVDSTVMAPPIVPGSHDHVDALDFIPPDITGDFVGDKDMYFSVNPTQRVLTPLTYASPADIYRLPPAPIGPQAPVPFASALSMGLVGDPDGDGRNTDDVDALELFDRGVIGVLDLGDYALFSLSPGSISLTAHELTAADIFFTDFSGSFATFVTDADLGLSGTATPVAGSGAGTGLAMGSGTGGSANVSATSGSFTGDMDWDGDVDTFDIDDFVEGLTRPSQYRAAHEGYTAPMNGDFSEPEDYLVDFDDISPFRTEVDRNAGTSSGLGIPEPTAASLAAIAFAGLVGLGGRLSRCRSKTGVRCQVSGVGSRDLHRRTRIAYTIVELLVVVTIISILMALLMPAIQAARESARSAQCSNNLKQFALALHSYHSSHNRFPPGSTLAPRPDAPGDSWHVYCLAYLEEQEVADRILKRRQNIAPAIPVFFCPSDPVVFSGTSHFGNYYGSGGAGIDPDHFINLDDEFCGNVYTDGILYPLSKTSANNITDGLSHTLAVGERIFVKHIWAHGAYWVGSADRELCLLGSKNVRWPINSPRETSGYYVFDSNAPAGAPRSLLMNDLFFGSQHPGGAWFAFAGGNVQFIAEDIAFSVYQDLATRNGGEVLEAEGAQ